MVWNGFGLIRIPAPTTSNSGPRSLARNTEVAMMSCPFAGMTRIRFKGSPRWSRKRDRRSLSSSRSSPRDTVDVGGTECVSHAGEIVLGPATSGRPVGSHRRVTEYISIILQKPLDVIELFLRPGEVTETFSQFFDDAPRALHVDLARHFHRGVVAVFAPAHRPPQRIGVLLRARLAETPRASLPRPAPHLLLHGLRQALSALAQGIERAALRLHRAVGIALAEITSGVAHGVAGAAELIELVLT